MLMLRPLDGEGEAEDGRGWGARRGVCRRAKNEVHPPPSLRDTSPIKGEEDMKLRGRWRVALDALEHEALGLGLGGFVGTGGQPVMRARRIAVLSQRARAGMRIGP